MPQHYRLPSLEDHESEAPEPLSGDVARSVGYETIGSGQGVVAAKRDRGSRSEGAGLGRRATVVVGVLAVAVILGMFLFVSSVMGNGSSGAEEADADRSIASTEEGITHHGYLYTVSVSEEGTYSLVATPVDDDGEATGESVSEGDLDGTPVVMATYDGSILLPQNLGEGWSVAVYTIGSGWSELVDAEGVAYGGDGTISSASLEDSTLAIVTDSGEEAISLE